MAPTPPLLLVDDDELTARSVQRLLKRAPQGVVHVGSCKAARQLTTEFSTGILDVELGDGDGIDLAMELLATGRLESVVFYTACVEAERLRHARRLGEVIVKGASGRDLLDAVDRASKPRTGNPPTYGDNTASAEGARPPRR